MALQFSTWLIGIILLVVTILYRWLVRCNRTDPAKRLPGPKGLPWIGYLPWIDSQAPYETFTRLAHKYGPIYSLKLGVLETVFVSDPALIRQAFNRDVFSGRAPLYLTHGIMKGQGLICAEGDTWREHRRFIVTVMRELGMAGRGGKQSLMESRIMERVVEFVQGLEESTGDVDLVPGLRHCIGNIINGVVFGRTYEMDDPTWIWLQHLLDEGIKAVAVAGPLNFLPILRFLPKYRRTMSFVIEGQRETHRHYQEIIDAHRLPDSVQGYSDVIEAYLAEMDKRKESPGSFTVSQLYHVLADMFGAGTDTSLSTIKWIVLYMILHPDIQDKAYAEIDQVIGAERTPSYPSDAIRMPFTEAVFCEVQRINTILPLGVPHGTTDDCELGGFRIPKGSMVVPLLWAMNRDPNLWPDPLEFRPERFIDTETGTLRKPDYFMPFQCGRRMCVGDELGRSIIFLFTVTLLQRFRLSFPEGFRYDADRMKAEYGFVLIPPPHPVRLTRRC